MIAPREGFQTLGLFHEQHSKKCNFPTLVFKAIDCYGLKMPPCLIFPQTKILKILSINI
jgi:hypothetical protein